MNDFPESLLIRTKEDRPTIQAPRVDKPNNENQPVMIRTQNSLTLLVSFLTASASLPAIAEVALTLSSQKTFRQEKDSTTAFRGGRFDILLRDGNGIVVAGCARDGYWPPNIPLDPCPGGSTAFVLFGEVDPDVPNAGPYFWMTDVIPAIVIEPRRPDLAKLIAAPASKLPRPSTDFTAVPQRGREAW